MAEARKEMPLGLPMQSVVVRQESIEELFLRSQQGDPRCDIALRATQRFMEEHPDRSIECTCCQRQKTIGALCITFRVKNPERIIVGTVCRRCGNKPDAWIIRRSIYAAGIRFEEIGLAAILSEAGHA
jgi:hypothetical protein